MSAVSTPSGQTNVIIGQRISGGSIPFYGSMDEIRFWNTARTSAQLLANMNAEFCTIPLGLKAYFRFNEGVAGGNNTSITTALEDIEEFANEVEIDIDTSKTYDNLVTNTKDAIENANGLLEEIPNIQNTYNDEVAKSIFFMISPISFTKLRYQYRH